MLILIYHRHNWRIVKRSHITNRIIKVMTFLVIFTNKCTYQTKLLYSYNIWNTFEAFCVRPKVEQTLERNKKDTTDSLMFPLVIFMGYPRPLFRFYFKTHINTILHQIKMKKCPSIMRYGIRTHDRLIISLYPLPLDQSSRPRSWFFGHLIPILKPYPNLNTLIQMGV